MFLTYGSYFKYILLTYNRWNQLNQNFEVFVFAMSIPSALLVFADSNCVLRRVLIGESSFVLSSEVGVAL